MGNKALNKRKEVSQKVEKEIVDFKFRDFMLKLCGPVEQIQGCPINIVETAFFDENGRVTEIVKNDKDGFITAIKSDQKSKSLLDTIRRTFTLIVRERRKETTID